MQAMRSWGRGAMAACGLLLLSGCGDDDRDDRRATATPTVAALPSGSTTPSRTGARPPVGAFTATPAAGTPTAADTTPSRTPTATRVPGDVVLAIDSVPAAPGETVVLGVRLAAGEGVVATLNDLTFALGASVVARADGQPDCTVNPAIGKENSDFAFQLPGCVAGVDCPTVRAVVIAFAHVDPIPVGALLYSCVVTVAAEAAAGPYAVDCPRVESSDADGNALPTVCRAGALVVASPP